MRPRSAARRPSVDVGRPKDAHRPSADEGPERPDVRPVAGTLDRRLAARAATTRGIVDLEDTDAVGLSRRAVSRRVAAGRLHRVHPGVFAVGHPGIDARARAVAALKAAGPAALLSHLSAVALWDLGPWPEAPHVTLPSRRRLAGVVTHRTRTMPTRVVRNGMRTTSAPQALLDFAEIMSEAEVSRVLNEALYARRTSIEALERFLSARPGRHGVAVLRGLLPDAGARHSLLEDEFFCLLRAARLPRPLSNVRVAGHIVDFWWPDARLVVETDGWAAHGTPLRFESDRERDADLLAAGQRVLRITRRALRTRPYAVTARLGAAVLGPAAGTQASP